jgi:diguanylate cyclase (GGDEF)-like protein
MKSVSDLLRSEPVWVNSQHRVESAIWLMRGHEIGSLPVLDGRTLVGLLMSHHVLGARPDQHVSDVMTRDFLTVPGATPLRQAAEQMITSHASHAPVVNAAGDLIGVVTYGDLLAELRRSADPLTDLPWSDSLQEWAIQQLREGHEITVLFIDVNDFGLFNKRFGHVIGDNVLRSVAGVLRKLTTPEMDSLCRYGGDEFCIATLRRADQAEVLAERISAEIADLRTDEAPDRTISVAVGIRGGRRSKEREHMHYASTLNNLINLASQDCTKKKAHQPYGVDDVLSLFDESDGNDDAVPGPHAPLVQQRDPAASGSRAGRSQVPQYGPPCAPLQLASVQVSWEENTAKVRVELETERGAGKAPNGSGRLPAGEPAPTGFVTELARCTDADGLLALVAEATVEAVRRAMPSGYDIKLEDVLNIETNSGRRLVTVTGTFVSPYYRHRVAGTVLADGDIHRAAASAVLRAANRHLEGLAIGDFEIVER